MGNDYILLVVSNDLLKVSVFSCIYKFGFRTQMGETGPVLPIMG